MNQLDQYIIGRMGELLLGLTKYEAECQRLSEENARLKQHLTNSAESASEVDGYADQSRQGAGGSSND